MPKGIYPRPTAETRFWTKVERTSTCWWWRAGVFSSGYGAFSYKGQNREAHRFSYEQIRGPIPDSLPLDHLCKNTLCVNPDHLEPVTPKENNRRSNSPSALHMKKTHCPRGHP